MKLLHTRQALEKMRAQNMPNTYALIVHKGDDEIFLHSPNVDEDTFFDIASLGKVLHTSPLILHAVGEGRLTLETAIGSFFEKLPPLKAAITIRQLLTHTSGIVRYPLPQEAIHMNHDQLAGIMLEHPLAFEPGTQMQYSCHGMHILGYILEKLYGDRLDRVVQKHLAQPLGLTRTRFNIALDEPNAADCNHRKDPGFSRCDDNNIRLMNGIGGSGGSFFSAHDVHRVVQAVLDKDPRLYPKELFDEAERDYTPNALVGRGLGWHIIDERTPRHCGVFSKGSIGHSGWSGQVFHIDRSKKLYVIFLSNAQRCAHENHGFVPGDYDMEVAQVSVVLHQALRSDLTAEKML